MVCVLGQDARLLGMSASADIIRNAFYRILLIVVGQLKSVSGMQA
jgi:hypothetical protein